MPEDVEADLWEMFEVSPKSREMLASKPILFDDLAPFWEAFSILHQSRPPAFSGQSPIPLSEISSYCDLYGVVRKRDRHEMVREVRRIDRIFLDVASRAAADRAARVPPSGSGRRTRGG